MDEIDIAQEISEQRQNDYIASIRRSLEKEGSDECVDCGEPIPAGRRRAMPNAERCVKCQEVFENGI